METLRRALGFPSGNQPELPQLVEKAFVLSKEPSLRGPVLHASCWDSEVLTVSPSRVVLIAPNSGRVTAQLEPEAGDAFTAAARLGELLVLGCQSGRVLAASASLADVRVCQAAVASISCMEPLGSGCLVLGTVTGQVLLYEPQVYPESPSVSLSGEGRPVTALAAVKNELWVAVDTEPIHVYGVLAAGSIHSLELRRKIDWHLPITKLAFSASQNLVVCLSGDLALLDPIDGSVVVQYPATLVTCGSPIACLESFEWTQADNEIKTSTAQSEEEVATCEVATPDVLISEVSEGISLEGAETEGGEVAPRVEGTLTPAVKEGVSSEIITSGLTSDTSTTFLLIGGVDGSLSVRELALRQRDGKLQCVLHRCIERLVPHASDACPVTSAALCGEYLVAGDASCSVFLVRADLKSVMSPTS